MNLCYNNNEKFVRRRKVKVAIIGGGASGLFCAGSLNNNIDVTIYEKNDQLGKKILITGNGRCNVTNNKNEQNFLQNVISNSKFLLSSIHQFSPQDLCQLLTQHGIEWVEEENNKIYPKSGKAKTIVQWLESRLKPNVKLNLNTTVESVVKQNNQFLVSANGNTETYDKVIVATGGKTYPVTGSTGYGYEIAKLFGHTVVTPRQSLCALLTELEPLLGCAGVQFLCKASIVNKQNATMCSDTGWLMLTHKGVSGPLTFTLAAKFAPLNIEGCNLCINFAHELSPSELKQQLDHFVANNPNQEIFEFVAPFLVKRFAAELKEKHASLLSTKCTSLSKVK